VQLTIINVRIAVERNRVDGGFMRRRPRQIRSSIFRRRARFEPIDLDDLARYETRVVGSQDQIDPPVVLRPKHASHVLFDLNANLDIALAWCDGVEPDVVWLA
jgi:hypothetical protein